MNQLKKNKPSSPKAPPPNCVAKIQHIKLRAISSKFPVMQFSALREVYVGGGGVLNWAWLQF